ncbi:NAD-dependent epimerase/dehydratase family protein [Candidatus Sumerlaeota bacterium]|nr:NAD-dependent epimerase/dehydratase family protein [Candidatus Sumerlaeota bacterium]
MKRALVAGAGGFVGGHLLKRLKREGYWVRGVDIKPHESAILPADEFLLLDLREEDNCRKALTLGSGVFDEVYQLAADTGGMGFIEAHECDIMNNNALINIHMIQTAIDAGAKSYFFSSSACVYRDMLPDEPELSEEEAYPAIPDNEYGWEKLYAERMALAYARNRGIKTRIARFQNCYGPEGTWRGGREKAPAAMCRKVAEAEDGGVIEVWGEGSAVRAYTYIDDMIEGIRILMRSDLEGPVNIGRQEYVSVDQLAKVVAEVARKKLDIRHVEGPVGVKARNFRIDKIKSVGWQSEFSLEEGIIRTYRVCSIITELIGERPIAEPRKAAMIRVRHAPYASSRHDARTESKSCSLAFGL